MKSRRIPSMTLNAGKIPLLALVLVIIGLSGSNVFAMDLMGSPTTELKKGMFRAGIEYSLSSMDLELINGTANVYRDGLSLGEGIADDLTIKDFEVNTIYANVGYGIYQNYELFVRLGMADATFGDSLWNEGEELDSKMNLALGAGIKATFYEAFNWKIGGLVQINHAEIDGKIDSSLWTIPQSQFAEVSTTEIQIALGIKYLYSRRISFYGGPFAHYISGNFDFAFNRIAKNFDTGEYSWEFKEGPTFGGYFGAEIKITRDIDGAIEYMQTSNANGFGASVMMRY